MVFSTMVLGVGYSPPGDIHNVLVYIVAFNQAFYWYKSIQNTLTLTF